MKKWTTQKMIYTGMLAAVAGVLMSLEISVPMMPPFYKVDFSDVPSFVALFTMGPASAVMVELIKIVIKLITVGTNSMYVGEFANLVGIALFVIPTWLVYRAGGRTKKAAVRAMAVSVPVRVAFSCCINAFITLPMYAAAMGLPLEQVITSVSAANPAIHNLTTFIILATIPFNLLKNGLNCLVAYFLYSRLVRVRVIEKAVV